MICGRNGLCVQEMSVLLVPITVMILVTLLLVVAVTLRGSSNITVTPTAGDIGPSSDTFTCSKTARVAISG